MWLNWLQIAMFDRNELAHRLDQYQALGLAQFLDDARFVQQRKIWGPGNCTLDAFVVPINRQSIKQNKFKVSNKTRNRDFERKRQ